MDPSSLPPPCSCNRTEARKFAAFLARPSDPSVLCPPALPPFLHAEAKKFAVILAFDVPVNKEARELAEEYGVKIFTADVIYHLFDQFGVGVCGVGGGGIRGRDSGDGKERVRDAEEDGQGRERREGNREYMQPLRRQRACFDSIPFTVDSLSLPPSASNDRLQAPPHRLSSPGINPASRPTT